MSRIVATTQRQLGVAQGELASGQYQDPGLRLGAMSGLDASLKSQASRIQSLVESNGLVSGSLDAARSAIDSIRSSAQGLAGQLAVWTPGSQGVSLKELGTSGLDAFVAATNTSYNGQYVLGGINSGQPPVNDVSSPMSPARSALRSAFTSRFGFPPEDPAAANITPDALQAFLDQDLAGQFEPGAWKANWSKASSENVRADIAPGRAVTISTNANQDGFRNFAMAATILGELGESSLSDAARSTVVSVSSSLLARSASDLAKSEAGLGVAQSEIRAATTSMQSQATIIQAQIAGYEQADPYVTATSISVLTTRLQSAYQLTAQLQQLSLVKYLGP